jgi:hypothetical protein
VDDYSRERAAGGLVATVQKRMAGAMVAREMEWEMIEKGADRLSRQVKR